MKTNIVFRNGVVYTANKSHAMAEAVAVADGKIVYVGDKHGVEKYNGKDTEAANLGGKMLTPSEGHAHYTNATSTVVGIDLAGMGKEADMIVVDENVLTCKSKDIGIAQAERTMFRGETLYKKL